MRISAGLYLFQQAPQFHLQRVGVRWQAEMQIEKPMIDRLQTERERQASIDLSADLRITRHGAK